MKPNEEKGSFDWKWLVTSVIAIASVAINVWQFRINGNLAEKAVRADAPFLDLSLGRMKSRAFPDEIRIRNAGKRSAYNMRLGFIGGVRLRGHSDDSPGPPARPDPIPLPKAHLLAGDTLVVALPKPRISDQVWNKVLGGSELADLFFVVNFFDEGGVHTEWYCFEYNHQVSRFAACANFQAPPEIWISEFQSLP